MDSALRRTRGIATSIVEPVTDVDERDLLSRIAARDREAMRDFYLLYHPRIARFLTRITARCERVEDIVNEAFMIVWRRAAEFSGDSRVSTWVMGIAWRHGLTIIRRERHLPEYPASSKIPPAVEAEYPESRDALARAMSTLSPKYRALIDLVYVGAYSCDEIGEIMKCPVNVVKRRLIHARRRLREELEAGPSSDATVGRLTPSAHGADNGAGARTE